jgi:hypothetical protein
MKRKWRGFKVYGRDGAGVPYNWLEYHVIGPIAGVTIIGGTLLLIGMGIYSLALRIFT